MKNTEKTFRKGSIFLTEFPFTNLKQSKIRPVVVISCDEAYGDVIVMAISSVTSRRDLSNTIILSPADAEFSGTGLKKESCILIHRIATIKKDRLFYRLGNLAQRYLEDIDKLVLRKFEIGVEKKQKQKSIPYGKQSVDTNDVFSVIKALRSDWLTTGPKVSEFERAFAQFVGAKYAVAVSSGTAALHAAMYALDIRPGDEVIVPPMTFAATANCVVYMGGTPVFADVDRETLLIDPDKVEEKITKETKAIIAVDYAGQPCEYNQLQAIADRYGLKIVADGCHALGTEYKGRKVGSLTDMTVFSFHPVKHITTGEGGMVTTDDSGFAQKIRVFRNHGITTDHLQRKQQDTWLYGMVDLGYNYRITDFQCALGISQLKKLPEWIVRRQEIASHYDAAFAKISGIQPPRVRQDVSHAYHLYVIKIDFQEIGVDRASFFKDAQEKGVSVNVHYIPVHLHPYYRERLGTGPGLCPVAEAAYEKILSLPMYSSMSDKDVERVISTVNELIDKYT